MHLLKHIEQVCEVVLGDSVSEFYKRRKKWQFGDRSGSMDASGGQVRGIVVEEPTDVRILSLLFVEVKFEIDKTWSGSIPEGGSEGWAAMVDVDLDFQRMNVCHLLSQKPSPTIVILFLIRTSSSLRVQDYVEFGVGMPPSLFEKMLNCLRRPLQKDRGPKSVVIQHRFTECPSSGYRFRDSSADAITEQLTHGIKGELS